ncbi:MAG: lysophospholipid acyltransferase family protein [Bacteroidia bacterium]|nr:lysophospholipid acyltransferase family protein [Bacteroidia bacterium]
MLPFPIWYLISDGLYLLFFHLIKYRRKVVWKNISTSFPENTQEENEAIMSSFYRHLCDVLVETIKAVSLSNKQVEKRVSIENPEVWQEFIELEGGAFLLAGHYGNFELWGARMDIMAAGVKQGHCVYTPQKSDTLNRLIHYSRARRGGLLLARKDYVRNIRKYTSKGNFIVVLADQSPQKSQRAYFTKFLGKPTAFFTSTAKYSLELELPVFFIEVKKVRRGHYSLTYHQLPLEEFLPFSQENVYRYTDLQVGYFERMIKQDPAYWLWTHKRWKRPPAPKDKLSPSLTKKA